jgi:hypothetical protein
MPLKLPVIGSNAGSHAGGSLDRGALARRDVLGAFGLGAGALLLGGLVPWRRAGAQSAAAANRKFIFAYFEGGWDILLGLDPRDPATTNPTQHLIDPAYSQLQGVYAGRGVQVAGPHRFGPAVPPQILALASEVSIINGITMDTAAHEVGRRYFITGRFPRGLQAVGSSTAAEIVAQIGESTPIAHMSAGVESYATGLPPYAAALNVNSLADLLVALVPLASLDPAVKAAVEAFQDGPPGCEAVRMDRDGLTTALGRSVVRSRSYLKAQLDKVFDIGSADPEMAALRTLYDVNAAAGDLAAPEVLAFIAGQAIKKKVSQCVSVRVAAALDTHGEWAQDQAPRQERGWKALAALIQDLKNTPSPTAPGGTLLGETTILAFSEFGRTPLFNTIRGRDHFLGNSCLVAGAGVKKGVVVGQSAAVGMMPLETDLATGRGVETPTPMQRDSGAVQILTPKHVLATVLASAGLDGGYLRVPPISALL